MTTTDQNQDNTYSELQGIILKWSNNKRPLSGFVNELLGHEQAAIDKAVGEAYMRGWHEGGTVAANPEIQYGYKGTSPKERQ